MKLNNIQLHRIILISAVLLVGLMGCDPDEPLTLQEKQVNALKGTWAAQSDTNVTLDGADAPGDWTDFTITFSDDRINTSNVPTVDANIWADALYVPSGSGDTNSFSITIGPDEVTVTISSADNLTLNVTLTGPDDKIGSRTEGVTGVWNFNLTKIN